MFDSLMMHHKLLWCNGTALDGSNVASLGSNPSGSTNIGVSSKSRTADLYSANEGAVPSTPTITPSSSTARTSPYRANKASSTLAWVVSLGPQRQKTYGPPTLLNSVARVFPLHGRGRRFESYRSDHIAGKRKSNSGLS